MFFLIGEFSSINLTQASNLIQNANELILDKSPIEILDNVRDKQAFLYTCSFDGDSKFMADGIRWTDDGHYSNKDWTKVYYSASLPPSADSSKKKARSTKEFQRSIFYQSSSKLCKNTFVLIWYKGDHSKASLFAHGNSKTNKPFLGVVRSTRNEIKKNCFVHPSISLTFETLSSNIQLNNGNYFLKLESIIIYLF